MGILGCYHCVVKSLCYVSDRRNIETPQLWKCEILQSFIYWMKIELWWYCFCPPMSLIVHWLPASLYKASYATVVLLHEKNACKLHTHTRIPICLCFVCTHTIDPCTEVVSYLAHVETVSTMNTCRYSRMTSFTVVLHVAFSIAQLSNTRSGLEVCFILSSASFFSFFSLITYTTWKFGRWTPTDNPRGSFCAPLCTNWFLIEKWFRFKLQFERFFMEVSDTSKRSEKKWKFREYF